MGLFLKEDDIYIGRLLDNLNLRFAPAQEPADGLGGIAEMVELQKKFQVFSSGHSLRDCAALLGLGGSESWRAKNRWFELLEWLDRCPSETAQTGGARIVSVLEEHLASYQPSPVYFTAHALQTDKRVLIRPGDRPVFYMDMLFLTISLPMQPR
jgi:hypothetical protein